MKELTKDAEADMKEILAEALNEHYREGIKNFADACVQSLEALHASNPDLKMTPKQCAKMIRMGAAEALI